MVWPLAVALLGSMIVPWHSPTSNMVPLQGGAHGTIEALQSMLCQVQECTSVERQLVRKQDGDLPELRACIASLECKNMIAAMGLDGCAAKERDAHDGMNEVEGERHSKRRHVW